MTAREAFPDPQAAALVEAAERGDLEQLDAAIRSGANVNAVGKQGVTPLIWVLGTRNKQATERLLQAGANPNHKGFGGADESAMSLAAGGNDPALLELLLKHRGDPNIIGPRNRPVLHIAALGDRRENMQVLLKYGADINIHTQDRRTAGDVAAAMGNFDQVAYLLEQGLSYDLKGLAQSVEIRQVPRASEQYQWKLKVIEMLKSRGVKFPALTRGAPPPPPPRQ
jgi:ankyrin repeat protein